MDLGLTIEPHDMLVVTLRDGADETTVSVHPRRPAFNHCGARSMRRLRRRTANVSGPARPAASTGGSSSATPRTLEVIVMWTRGGAALWEHVFRATDAAGWVSDRLMQEIDRLARRA
jgi:hypothetical protein